MAARTEDENFDVQSIASSTVTNDWEVVETAETRKISAQLAECQAALARAEAERDEWQRRANTQEQVVEHLETVASQRQEQVLEQQQKNSELVAYNAQLENKIITQHQRIQQLLELQQLLLGAPKHDNNHEYLINRSAIVRMQAHTKNDAKSKFFLKQQMAKRVVSKAVRKSPQASSKNHSNGREIRMVPRH